MSSIGYVRLRTPKTVKKGEIATIRTLITHPMEGIQRDAGGNVKQKNYHFVNSVKVFLNGKEIAKVLPTQSISANPFFAIAVRLNATSTIKVVYEDTYGKTYEASKTVTVK